jgi:hypothetical protein
MRYPASEKLEIIRVVEQSHLPVRRTLEKIGIARATFYTGMISIDPAASKPLRITAPGLAGCGTVSPMR